jgi:hypothetical protein
MTKPNNLIINKLQSIITEEEGKRVCQIAAGGRAQGGVDPAEEERGPDDSS